jgi:hypothetical protein
MGNTGTSPQTSARVQSPTNQTESSNQTRAPPSILSPHTYRYNHETGFKNVIPKIVPPTPHSDDRTTETGHERGIGSNVLREPSSPATPSSSRYSASSEHSPGGIASPVDGGSTESTLKGPQRYPWMGDFPGNSTMMQAPSESTVVPTRKERPDIKPLPQRPTQAPIHQAHPYTTPPPLPLPPYPIPRLISLRLQLQQLLLCPLLTLNCPCPSPLLNLLRLLPFQPPAYYSQFHPMMIRIAGAEHSGRLAIILAVRLGRGKQLLNRTVGRVYHV